MRAYSVWIGEPEDGACLVFAYTAKEARRLAAPIVLGWSTDSEWIDVRVRWLKTAGTNIWSQRQRGKPHAIEEPISCENCFQWGVEMSTEKPELCTECADYAEHAEFVEGEIVRGAM